MSPRVKRSGSSWSSLDVPYGLVNVVWRLRSRRALLGFVLVLSGPRGESSGTQGLGSGRQMREGTDVASVGAWGQLEEGNLKHDPEEEKEGAFETIIFPQFWKSGCSIRVRKPVKYRYDSLDLLEISTEEFSSIWPFTLVPCQSESDSKNLECQCQ
ncbi:hypothetical protein B0H17DRAFT_1145912 [Mycena rosella]|uniref:Uncharacterized protein n=1 Tax=Mycena rosella TaxID=1033263 RepID=A0AAD7CQ24_MYCRO|nr:hypothetical protein B0H17DRAFT_1145912 [Mycena rosella]